MIERRKPRNITPGVCDEIAAELATANTEIENLHERIRELEEVNRSLVDKANSYIVESGKLTNELVAEREVSDKLVVALQIAVSTCFTEHAHHKYMSDPESPIRALLAEVAAIRSKGE